MSFEVFRPGGSKLGEYDSRADAEHAIERDIQEHAGEYVISDVKFRAEEARKQGEERKKEEDRKVDTERQRAEQERFAAERQ
jgi:hypothetical protein